MSELVYDAKPASKYRSSKSVIWLTCRCCNIKIQPKIVFCGYCGESVSQLDCRSPYGKWFHNNCFDSFRNFYKSIFNTGAVKNRRDLQSFKDHILFEMIMRHDLRVLKEQWSLLVYNKAVPMFLANHNFSTDIGVNFES